MLVVCCPMVCPTCCPMEAVILSGWMLYVWIQWNVGRYFCSLYAAASIAIVYEPQPQPRLVAALAEKVRPTPWVVTSPEPQPMGTLLGSFP
jgi:hypothetical protein